MFDTDDDSPVVGLAAVVEQVRALIDADWQRAGSGELVEALCALQRLRNVTDAVEQQVLAVAVAERVHEPLGFPSAATMLIARTRVSRGEANARVRRAEACTPRVSLTGERLPAQREQLAAGQAAGDVSAAAADVIVRGLAQLPAHVPVEAVVAVEGALVELAGRAEPSKVAAAVRHAHTVLDPDGREPRDRQIDRRRCFGIWQRPDGMGELHGPLTPELTTKLQTVLSPLAAPHPGGPEGPDSRTPGQRMHDALEDLCDRLLASGTLPDHGGTPLSLVVMIDLDDLTSRTGQAVTSHGTTLDVDRILRAAGEMEVVPVVCTQADGIVAYGTTRRLASPGQTKALRGRDRGCSFPDCDRPPDWCQRHHLQEVVRDHGETDLDNLTLVCGYHHRTFTRHGWQTVMINGRPHWIPPASVDPDQTPRRNTAHDPPHLPTAA